MKTTNDLLNEIEELNNHYSNALFAQTKLKLANEFTADVAILHNNEIIAIGNHFEESIVLHKNPHHYFHKHGFIGGGYGNCWFLFNDHSFVYHDIRLDYPVDLFTTSLKEIVELGILNKKEFNSNR